jgi:hypothetical protein
MHTVMVTNGGCDTILLVDDSNMVRSAWTVDRETLDEYLANGDKADGWELGQLSPDRIGATDLDECNQISDYGTEVGSNGKIADKRRREFWGLL